jgi:single-strand DNA-binding protein
MVNKVILVGNLTKDAEYKHASTTIALLNLATNESWTDKQTGEKKSKAEYHRVVIFGVLADVCQKLQLRKGSKLYVEGQLTHRSYEQNGQKKYITEVKLSGFNSALQLLDTKGEAKGEMEIGDLGEPKPFQQPITPVASDGFENDMDDIPF